MDNSTLEWINAFAQIDKLEKQARETRGWLDQEHAQRDKLHIEVIERIRQLEKHIHYPHNELKSTAALKEAAARAQGNSCRIEGYHAAARAQSPSQCSFADSYAKCTQEQKMRPNNPPADAVPMRSDVETILTLTAFCKRLLDTHDLAHAVTKEVRNEARRALGLKKREL